MSNCVFCSSQKTRREDFNDSLSIREFRISGVCQECQDKTFVEPTGEQDEV